MSAPAMLRGNFADLFTEEALPALEELFRWELAQHPSRRSQLIKQVSTDRDIYQTSEVADLPIHSVIAEGQDYNFYAMKQGANKTVVPVKYGLGFSISEEAVDDGKFDMISDAIRKMAKSAVEAQEIAGMNLFNNGFSSQTVADGLSLFNAAHTLPSGGTFRNQLSSAADLSVTSLETMLQDFSSQFVGDSGIIYNMKPKHLVVSPANYRLAKELIGSELKVNDVSSGSDNGATNAMNSFRDEGLVVVQSQHITDSDSWYLTSEASETGLRVVNRKGIETKSEISFDNDSIKYKSKYREKVDAVNAYGVFGTPGA